MADICAEKSQKILDTLRINVESFKNLLSTIDDKSTKQNILRAIILFSCAGIDAIVKQLVIESLESVIERDEGAQIQLREFTKRKLKKDSGGDYNLLAELLTARNSRKMMIDILKRDLSFDSLQSSAQLYRVASHFNIRTEKLISNDKKAVLDKVFHTRNVIVHQMDVDLEKDEIVYFEHDIDEVTRFFETIDEVAQNYINEVNIILKKDVTKDYAPLISTEDESLIIGDLLSSL